MDKDPLGPYPLPEPHQHPPRSLTLEYFPLSLGGDNNNDEDEDPEENPLGDPGPNPCSIVPTTASGGL
ncbi:hypothetical protein RJT34_16146 [Clitoria ternatea]|uniref:Uncharacterized protein n=1 Tax=Clitoria ternatea TaxID=43366 RepID=A0AAN9PC25_CLITE